MVSKTLFLTVGMSDEVVSEHLRHVQVDPSLASIHIVDFDFGSDDDDDDQPMNQRAGYLLLYILQTDQRQWNTIKLHHCRGKIVHRLVEAAMNAKVRRFLLAPTVSTTRTMMASLARGLASTSSLLTTLSLSDVRWNRLLLKLVGAALARNESLVELSLTNCRFPEHDASHGLLAKALKEMQGLQHLALVNCCLEDNQCQDLVEALIGNYSLLELNLEGNRCQSLALKALSRLLLKSSLLVLDLSSQKVPNNGSVDLRCLTPGLASSKLQCLQLSDNSIDLAGIQSLANALKANVCLRMLQLSWTPLDQAALLALANSLRWNTTLTKLLLHECGIDNFGLSRLANRLSHMRGLRHLDLGGMQRFDSVGLWSLQTGLQRNTEMEEIVLPLQNPKDRLYEESARQIFFYCDANRGGRRFLKSMECAPAGLWPLILSGVQHLEIPLSTDDSFLLAEPPSLGNESTIGVAHPAIDPCSSGRFQGPEMQTEARRASVLYYLLRNGPVLQR